MVLRIERAEGRDSVVLVLSGCIEPQHLSELQAQFAVQSPRSIIVDFKDVRLVDREVVETLARWDAEGIKLENCPAYVREWIAMVQGQK